MDGYKDSRKAFVGLGVDADLAGWKVTSYFFLTWEDGEG